MSELPVKVLYIDDDPGLRRLVQKDLERHGFAVETVADGPSGMARIAAGGIDLVVLDHYMPAQDGLATLEQIRGLDDPPPVVYVTGTRESRVAVAALKAGAVDYVIKELEGEFPTLLRTALAGALEARDMRRAKEAAEAEVRAARDRFEALAGERALLLREVNHRVANSLQLIASLLNLQASVAPLEEIRSALATATGRVSAAAQVHRRLYTSDNVESVALDLYLGGLIEDLRRSVDDDAAAALITVDADACTIDPDAAVAIGMLVTELVTNAIKYAYPGGRGPIRVVLRRDPNGPITMAVEDDGIGYGPARPAASGGFGQKIMRAMAQKLGAHIDQDRSHRGTRIVVTFAPKGTTPPSEASAAERPVTAPAPTGDARPASGSGAERPSATPGPERRAPRHPAGPAPQNHDRLAR
jgi:two-component sensor histidine kinase/CheY-like chemotaxis protein